MANPGGTRCRAARRLKLAAFGPTMRASWHSGSPSQWIISIGTSSPLSTCSPGDGMTGSKRRVARCGIVVGIGQIVAAGILRGDQTGVDSRHLPTGHSPARLEPPSGAQREHHRGFPMSVAPSVPPPAMPEPVTIPLPPNFPIDWPEPAMAMMTWQQDRQHIPEPITPMSAWWADHFAIGFSSGFASYGLPMGVRVGRFNCYFYMAIGPNVPVDQIPAMEAKAEPLLVAAIGGFWNRWETEWLPELKSSWDRLESFDQQAATDAQLLAFADQMTAFYERAWHIHFELLVPAFIAMSEFDDLYADLFPAHAPLDSYRLLQGLDNMSLEAGRELWRLSRAAMHDSTVREWVSSASSRDIAAQLEQTAEGQAFLGKVQEFVGFYGRRSDTVQELGDPSWTEDLTPVFDNVKAYVLRGEDPDVAHQRLAIERERHLAEAREAIKGYPEAVRGRFEYLLAGAQAGTRVQEDHNFWIDQRSLHEVRHLCLEFGQRLVERGQIVSPGDVFMLTMDEARDLLASKEDARALVASRRADMAHWRTITPPPMAGTDYGPPPNNPLTRAVMGKFFGLGPPKDVPQASTVSGNAGSSGVVTGVARVIMTIQDAGRLKQGEILVTPTTSPPWTPLFATAGGIVTDTGGALSHCAIVAREYGIPAVVGATGATAAIPDGATIEVNGDTGSVRILS
ncbi:MAG: hypothetical protein C0506_15325 [Anaerolinea sp.]|nr:hypothetical protein [Anaerolinea sp.]